MARPKKKIPKDAALPLIAAEAAGHHISRNEWQAAGGAQRDYRDFIALGRMKSEEFNAVLKEKMQVVASKILDKLEQKLDQSDLDDIQVNHLAVAFGITKDKLSIDAGRESEVKNLTQINLIGDASKASRELLIKAIFGESHDSQKPPPQVVNLDAPDEIPRHGKQETPP